MRKYEYSVRTASSEITLEKQLNMRAKNRWVVHNLFLKPGNPDYYVIVYYRVYRVAKDEVERGKPMEPPEPLS